MLYLTAGYFSKGYCPFDVKVKIISVESISSVLILILAVTVTYMKCWGLRASSLSAVTKVGAGQKASHKHLTPNILYMMLWLCCFICQILNI